MAFDPTLPDPSMTGGQYLNPAYATPNQRAMLYAYANQLMQPQQVHNGWQGMGEIARALVGGYFGHQADVQEQAAAAQGMQRADTGNQGTPGPMQPANDTTQGMEAVPSPVAAAPSGIGPSPVGSVPAANGPFGGMPDYANNQAGHEAYIRQAATAKGIDPDFAVATARAEGLGALSPSNPNSASAVDIDPKTGKPFSFGDFQLNVKNGLGTEARSVGIDPADPTQWKQADDYALARMAQDGLGPWKGDRAVEAYKAASGLNTPPGVPQHPVQVASNGPMAYAPPAGPASAPSALGAVNASGPGVGLPAAPPSGVAMPPVRTAQNGPAPLYDSRNLAYMLASPNASPQMQAMARELIQPKMMGNIAGDVSAVSPNVAPGQPPVFRGGATFAPSNFGGAQVTPAIMPNGGGMTGIGPIGPIGAGAGGPAGASSLASMLMPGTPTGDALAAQRANMAAGTAATTAGGASADAWGKDMTAAMNFQRQALPLQKAIPALERLGQQGTGPGSETWNEVMSFLNTAGVPGPDIAKIKDFDEAKKYLVQYATDTGSTGTNDKLAATFSGNPNMGVNNAAAVDVAKTALTMQRFKQAQVMSFTGEKDPTTGAPLSKDQYLDYSAKFQSTHDPRGVGVDLMSPSAKKSLAGELAKDPAARARFNASAQNAINLGLMPAPQ